jgi:hypothetical protein
MLGDKAAARVFGSGSPPASAAVRDMAESETFGGRSARHDGYGGIRYRREDQLAISPPFELWWVGIGRLATASWLGGTISSQHQTVV